MVVVLVVVVVVIVVVVVVVLVVVVLVVVVVVVVGRIVVVVVVVVVVVDGRVPWGWIFLLFTSFSLSAFSQTNTNALPALAPPYGELPPTFWEQHGATILIGGLLLVALAGLLAWNLLHPRPPVLPQPDVLAREALTRLLGQTEDGNHLSEISKVLRRYLVVVFVLPPGETTTAEFYAALAGNEKIGPELALAISDFLRECDERKFSPAVRSSAFTRSGPDGRRQAFRIS